MNEKNMRNIRLIVILFIALSLLILVYSSFIGMLIWGIIAIIKILILMSLLFGIIWFWDYHQEKKS